MYLVYFTVPHNTKKSALHVNTLSILYANFQLHCSSNGFPQCGMQMYVMADAVTLDTPNEMSSFLYYTALYTLSLCMHIFCIYIHCMHTQE
jgi:hypothetical protein